MWRWRTEIALLVGSAAGFLAGWHFIGLDLTGVALGGGAALLAGLPWARRFVSRRFWCLVTRHRLQAVFWELRLHTRKFRLPLVMWTRPTPVGERAWLLLRAGLSVEDFTGHASELATACAAREVRVTAVRSNSAFIVVDVIRRDLLAPGTVVPSGLPTESVPDWLALADVPGFEPVPEQGRWPGAALPLDAEVFEP